MSQTLAFNHSHDTCLTANNQSSVACAHSQLIKFQMSSLSTNHLLHVLTVNQSITCLPSPPLRLVASNTMERKIYYRQISKQGISNRVVDEMTITENFSKNEIASLVHEVKCLFVLFWAHALLAWAFKLENTTWNKNLFISQCLFLTPQTINLAIMVQILSIELLASVKKKH